jgi:DNA replication protein DnaC
LGDEYEIVNPNIINLVKKDLSEGNPFHYLFTGMVGSGKTYLGQQIVRSTIEYNSWSLVSAMQHYKKHIRIIVGDYVDKMDEDRKNDNKFSDQCLMLDDLGDEKPSTPASHDYFGGLIEKRYLTIKRNEMSRTIITTNLNAEMIRETYGSRVLDRLIEHFVICKFKRVSFREKKERIIEE